MLSFLAALSWCVGNLFSFPSIDALAGSDPAQLRRATDRRGVTEHARPARSRVNEGRLFNAALGEALIEEVDDGAASDEASVDDPTESESCIQQNSLELT